MELLIERKKTRGIEVKKREEARRCVD